MMEGAYENGVISYRHHYNLSKVNPPVIHRNLNRAREMLGFLFLPRILLNHIITSGENLPGNTASLSLYKSEPRENNTANS